MNWNDDPSSPPLLRPLRPKLSLSTSHKPDPQDLLHLLLLQSPTSMPHLDRLLEREVHSRRSLKRMLS
jgi:hypothetical protein